MHIGRLCAYSTLVPVDGVDVLMSEKDRTEGNWRLSGTCSAWASGSLGRGDICIL